MENRLQDYFREHLEPLPQYQDYQPPELRLPRPEGWTFGAGELVALGVILLAAVCVTGMVCHEVGYDAGYARAKELYRPPNWMRGR